MGVGWTERSWNGREEVGGEITGNELEERAEEGEGKED